MKNFKYFLVIMILFAISCRKFLLIPPPSNQIVSSEVFADSADAVSGITGIYIAMMQYPTNLYLGNGGITLATGLTGDEMATSVNNTDFQEFFSNAISPLDNTTNASGFWKLGYTTIYQVNACIEGLNVSTDLSTGLKNQLLGEALFDRAFLYFNLINLYGSVPLILGTNYQISKSIPRTSEDSIYEQIIGDLISAETLMTNNYLGTGNIRPGPSAAAALLARIYLYRQRWKDASSQASLVIGSGNYSLVSDLTQVFVTGSPEAIWQLSPVVPGFETTEGYLFVPTSTSVIPGYTLNAQLISSFEIGDNRRSNWLDSNVVNGVTYYYPFKYKGGNDGNSYPMEMDVVLRMSEQYLIRAEAYAEMGDNSDALNDLNIIRTRAGLPNSTASGTTDIIAAIRQERKVELFCEWGHRWFDLKREGIINAVLSVEKSGWSPTDSLFPIPNAEILLNPYLTQNPGY